MRCFLAIDLPKSIKSELGKIQKKLPEAKLNLVNPENIHLTIKFLGEIEDEQVESVKKALSSLKLSSFKAELGEIGTFSHGKFVRVLWIGLNPKDEFKGLHKEIDNKLKEIGFKAEKGFEAHATLARVKFIEDRRNFEEGLKRIKITSSEFNVKKVALKKSTLTKEGPIYEDIYTVTLN